MKPVYGSYDSQKMSVKSLEISPYLAEDKVTTVASLHPTVTPYGIFLKFRQKYSKRSFFATATRKGNGKAIPLQAWTGPEGSRSLRLPDFKTIGT
jgi:hypothetical protein